MRFNAIPAAAIAATLIASPLLAASPKDWGDCRGKNADKSIAGCARVLADKRLTARERAEAYYNRGLAYKANDDSDKAVADYTSAINADPKWAVPYAKRGDVYDDQGKRDLAIEDLSEAIRLNPNYDWAYAIRGYIFDQQGKYDRAIADYSEAIRLDPKDVGTLANRGWTKRKNGDLDGAFVDFNAAIRLDPKYVRAYYNRGLAWNDRQDYDRAIADFNEAIRLDPKGDVAYHDRGLTRFYKGDFSGSADDFKRSNDLKPESFTVLRMYVARSRSGANANAEFAEAAAALSSKKWPRPIIEFYLGERSAYDMTAAAADDAERRCDAQFYLGQWQILQDKRGEAAETLRGARAEGCPKYLFEYVASGIDLNRIKP